jgi:hypothetical protein
MNRKISLIIATVGAALMFTIPAVAQGSPGRCPEKPACQKLVVRPKLQPQQYTTGPEQTWRAGDHIMR